MTPSPRTSPARWPWGRPDTLGWIQFTPVRPASALAAATSTRPADVVTPAPSVLRGLETDDELAYLAILGSDAEMSFDAIAEGLNVPASMVRRILADEARVLWPRNGRVVIPRRNIGG